MKACHVYILLLTSLALFASCNSEEDQSAFDEPQTLTLSGDETATAGTEINFGEIDYNRPELTGITEAIVAVDENTNIIGESIPVPGDFDNFVIFIVSSGGISATITKDAVEHDYACVDTTYSDNSIDCGNLTFNAGESGSAIFDNVEMINTDTGSVLTVSGELNW